MGFIVEDARHGFRRDARLAADIDDRGAFDFTRQETVLQGGLLDITDAVGADNGSIPYRLASQRVTINARPGRRFAILH
ncbi:hypothetical protein [Sphingomonas sp. CARO-RG-8B-R24-01]|uniref:hypothetical protein n=1 Tax=Sphingomonas sp. CARO-RG-8B-R24-01 TaxID=2914831 RepID=UPI001F5A8C97|nr:hypothetical protein [Sphingomonas sp. CARO-RG-8B-R24-01]